MVSLRDRIIGAILVLIVLAAQKLWMGPAIMFLSGGLILAYVVWVTGRWKNDVAEVLPLRNQNLWVDSGSGSRPKL